MINIDELIFNAAKNKETVKLATYRLLKADIVKYNTSKEALKKPMDDAIQLIIIKKFADACKETMELCGKSEVGEEACRQLEIVNELLPTPVSENELVEYISTLGKITKKTLGAAIKAVKEKYPTSDGKIISQLIKERIIE